MTQGRDCVREVSMLKAFSGELANEATYTCQQFHGGMGYMRESAIERLVRDAIGSTLYSGTSEMQRNIIARWIGVGEAN